MILQNEICSQQNLTCLLEDDQTSVEYQNALEHLERCANCQQRIEQLAANSEAWQSAKAVLTSDEFIERIESTEDPCLWDHQPVVWSESMASQLLAPASHPEMLGRIGRYDVERLIGSGGMGLVFKAYDTELNRFVAIKVLAPYIAGNGSARKRFAREARAAAAIVNDNVVAIHNVELNDNPEEAPFLVMKYIAGGSLQQRIDRDGPLDICEILRIGIQIARGLAAAHAQGLIHRDVKPSNILMDEGVERALLTDFGLARAEDDACLTRSGFHPGTPHYMAPEQVLGQAIDARSDLFGLGGVLYAMCVGHPPFRAENSFAVLRRITDDHARPIRELNALIPDWMEEIVMRLLEKKREDRFESAEQVASLLGQCLAHMQHPAQNKLPDSVAKPGYRHRVPVATRPRMILGALLAAFILTACGFLAFQTKNQTQEPTKTTESAPALNLPSFPLQEATPFGEPREMTVAEQELQKLYAEHLALAETYDKACDNASNETELNRALEELDPREIMPPKFLEMESRFRGTKFGLHALTKVADMAVSVGDPGSVAAKGRVEAIDRMIEHYLKHEEPLRVPAVHGIWESYAFESVIHGLDGWPIVPRANEFLNLLVKESPNLKTQAAALIQLIKNDKLILDFQTQIPELRKMMDEHGGQMSEESRLQYELFIQKVESTDMEQLRIDVNEKLRMLSRYGDTKVRDTYDTVATAAARLSYAINQVVIGKPAPEIKMLDIDGKQFHLSDLRGSIVILLFDHSSQFKDTHSSIRQMVAKYRQFPVRVVSVMGTKNQEELKASRDRGEINWTVLPEEYLGPLFQEWGIEGYPTVHIIDKDGILSAPLHMSYYGAGGYDTSEVVAKVDGLLKNHFKSDGGSDGNGGN